MLAVLEESVLTFRRTIAGETRREQPLLLETEEWFRSNDDAWTFAFESICNTPGLDPICEAASSNGNEPPLAKRGRIDCAS